MNLSLAPKGVRTCSAPAPRPRTSTRLRSVERAVRYEMQRHAAVLDLRRLDPPGDPALARGHRRHHQRPREVRRRGLPLLPRARPGAGRAVARVGRASCAAACPSPPLESGPGCRPSGASPTSRCATRSAPARWGWSRRPIAAGAAPQAARKWWLGELARRANDAGLEIAELGVTPADVAGSRRWSTRARSTTSSPARSSTACSPARAPPRRSSPPAGWRSSPTRARSSAAVDNAIAANPDVAEKIRDGKVAAAGALIGAVMKEMRGQADAGRVRELILEKLHADRRRIRTARTATSGSTRSRSRCARVTHAHHHHARGGGSRSDSGADPQP